jgi:L-lactate dehydrogenase
MTQAGSHPLGSGMKVGLIGAGKVGSACLQALAIRGVAREIVVVNRTPEVAKGIVTDLQYGAPLYSPVELRAGSYDDLAGAQLVLVTAGINEQAGGATDRGDEAGRLRLLDENVAVYRDMIPKIVQAAPQAVILAITDPPDPLADLARRLAGHDRVLSAGTFLDTLRFRFHLGRALGVHPGCVEAQVLGEHGTSQVFVWSSARVAGVPVHAALGQGGKAAQEFRERIEQEVRYANIAIIEGTGASQLGIGVAVARMTEMILQDEQAAIPIGTHHARYGVTLSLPAVVGHGGVRRVLEPELDEAERQALDASADTLRQAVARFDR